MQLTALRPLASFPLATCGAGKAFKSCAAGPFRLRALEPLLVEDDEDEKAEPTVQLCFISEQAGCGFPGAAAGDAEGNAAVAAAHGCCRKVQDADSVQLQLLTGEGGRAPTAVHAWRLPWRGDRWAHIPRALFCAGGGAAGAAADGQCVPDVLHVTFDGQRQPDGSVRHLVDARGRGVLRLSGLQLQWRDEGALVCVAVARHSPCASWRGLCSGAGGHEAACTYHFAAERADGGAEGGCCPTCAARTLDWEMTVVRR